MAGPWEKYQQQSEAKPWEKYSAPPPSAPEEKGKPTGSGIGEPGTQMEDAQRDTLSREVGSLGSSLARTPGSIYHAFADVATPEEISRFGKDQVSGSKRVGLGLQRMIGQPIENAVEYYKGYAHASPEQRNRSQSDMLAVAPEAIGVGASAPVGGKLLEMAPRMPRVIADAAPTAKRLGGVAIDAAKAGAKAAIPKAISRPFRAAAGAARESWQASAPKPGLDAMSAAVPAETDALSEAASGRFEPPQAPPQHSSPEFVSDDDVAEHALSGGLRLPSIEDARWGNLRDIYEHQDQGLQLPTPDEASVANSDRMLNQTRNWRRDRALYDPVGYQEGPTPEQAQAARDFFHSPLRNWNGDPIAVRSKASEYAPAELSQDLTPALEESLRRVRLAKERAGATKKGPTRGEK